MIRKATAADVSAIKSLLDANSDTVIVRSVQELSDLINSFWVADDNGEILGCCCLEVYSQKIAELRSLAVRKDAQGRGIGRDLAQVAIDEAKARKIPEVLAITSNTQFFERLNFGPCLNEKFALFWSGKR